MTARLCAMLAVVAWADLWAQTVVPPTSPAFLPGVSGQPQSITEAIGGNVVFRVSIQLGNPYPTFQWFKDGQPVPGATGQTLFLASITEAQAGSYACRASNSAGSATSDPARLKVIPAFIPGSAVDAIFVPRPAFDTAPRVVAPQPDGKVLVGGDFVVFNEGSAQVGIARLNPDGSLDSTFKPPAMASGGYVNAIAVQADGRIVVGGKFSPLPGRAVTNLVRLQSGGAVDPTFNASLSSIPSEVLLTADGKILVADGTDTLTRLNLNGSNDPAFVKTPVPVHYRLSVGGIPEGGNFDETLNAPLTVAAIQPDGKILVTGTAVFRFRTGPFHILTMRRFMADGSLDAAFTPYTDTPVSSTSSPEKARALRALTDGRIVLVTPTRAIRFASDGHLDASYVSATISSFIPRVDTVAAVARDGKVWFFGSGRLARIDANGQPDPSFNLQNSYAPSSVGNILPLDDGRAYIAGNFTQIDGVARTRLARVNPMFDAPNPPYWIGGTGPERPSGAGPERVRAGESFSVTLRAAGSMPLTYSVAGSPPASGPTVIVTIDNPQGQTVVASATVTGAGNVSLTGGVTFQVDPTAPGFSQQPRVVQARSGESVSLRIDGYGSDPRTYQWFRNGEPIAGATTAVYSIARATIANGGDYTLVVRNGLGIATSSPIHLGVDELPRLANLSTRGMVGLGENILITGFVITGSASKTLLLRGIGPSLASFGVTGVLANPRLAVLDAGGRNIAENDDWSANQIGDAFTRTSAFPLPAGSSDAALVVNLPPGRYTAQLSGVGGGAGVGLLELYETVTDPVRLTNLSTRATVGSGSNVVIPGIVVSGLLPVKLLIRAVGPSLTTFGVQDPIADPVLNLIDKEGATVAASDDWEASAALTAAAAAVGAFNLPVGSKDAATVVTVPPGSYTAVVRGAGTTSGIVLVEVYEVP